MKKVFAALVGLMFVVATSSAILAKEEGSWYGGLGIGAANLDYSVCGDPSINPCTDDDTDTGWKLFGGYAFNPNFALELGYTKLGASSASGVDSTIGAFAINSDIDGFNLDAVGTLPLNEEWSLTGRIGAYRWNDDVSGTLLGTSGAGTDDGTDLKLGFGVAHKWTDNFSTSLDWEKYNLEYQDPTLISLNFVWAFKK